MINFPTTAQFILALFHFRDLLESLKLTTKNENSIPRHNVLLCISEHESVSSAFVVIYTVTSMLPLGEVHPWTMAPSDSRDKAPRGAFVSVCIGSHQHFTGCVLTGDEISNRSVWTKTWVETGLSVGYSLLGGSTLQTKIFCWYLATWYWMVTK